MNKYEYLEEEALRLSKKARQNIPQSEQRFYRAIYKIKEVLFKSGMMNCDEILNDLIGFPVTVREALDQHDAAKDMLRLAMMYKRMEAISNDKNT